MTIQSIMRISVVLFAFSAVPSQGSDAIVGKIYDVATRNGKITAIFIAPENRGKQLVTISCETSSETQCKAGPDTAITIGEKVMIEKKSNGIFVNKITVDRKTPW